MSKLYDYIEQLATLRGESITSMCKKCGIARSSLTELKKGRAQTLSYTTMEKLSRFFGMSIEMLANCGEEPKEPEIDDFAFALYNETKGLNEEQKKLLMSLAKELNSRKD